MSLVRSFTKRARGHTRGSDDPTPTSRNGAIRFAPGTINRAKISLPTELLSTTNVHALNAPDIGTKHSIDSLNSSHNSSAGSFSENDFSSIDKSFLSVDNSSLTDLSPLTPMTPLGDMMADITSKDFFSSQPVLTGPLPTPTPAMEPVQPTPAIPTRAPSHSKKAHVELSRQKSFQRSMSPPPIDIVKLPAPATKTQTHSKKISESTSHPFSLELAKVDEIAERFGAKTVVLDEEENEMISKGLRKFSVDDYLAEITGLTGGVYDDRLCIDPWAY